ncbi:MAG: WD40 repeat domain-containing protein, partial [Planctomycetaceae bacterium]
MAVIQTGRPGHVCVAFSPDGTALAVGASHGVLKVARVPDGRERATLSGHTAAVRCLAWSPDGQWLASGSADSTVRIWNGLSYELEMTLTPGTAVTALAFAPDNRNLVIGCEDGTATIWDLPTQQQRVTLAAHDGATLSLALSPDAKTLATGGIGSVEANGGTPGEVKLWSVGDSKTRATFSTGDGRPIQLAFSPNGHTLAAAISEQTGTVALWDVDSREPLEGPTGIGAEIQSIAFAPNGKMAVIGFGGTDERPGRVVLYELKTWRAQMGLEGHNGGVTDLAFSADGRFLTTAGKDGLTRLWSMAGAGTAVEQRVDETAQLREPKDAATLPNGRGGRLKWDFTWSPVERAEAYEIVVQHVGSANPAVSERVGSTSYRYDKVGAVSPENAEGWVWRVRAVRDGKPLPLS